MTYSNMYPVLQNNWILFHRPNGGFIKYDSEKVSKKAYIYDLTELSVKTIMLCDGTKTVIDILSSINDTCEGNGFSSVDSAGKFLFELIQNDIIGLSKNPGFHPITEKGSDKKFYPMHFAVELTDGCNLKCKHCYRECGPDKAQYLPLRTLMGIFDNLHRNDVQSLELSGGEPTSHPDIEKILEYTLSNFCSVALLTNGTLFNNRLYDILESYRDKAVVQIDLDGHNAEEHDRLRGIHGAFNKALSALAELSDRGVNVRVAMSLYNENYKSIEKTYNLAKQKGARWFVCSPIMDVGRANENMLLTWEQLKWSMAKMNELANNDPETVLIASEMKRLGNSTESNCGAGSKSLALGPDGSLRPCFLVNRKIPGFKNIFDTTFEDAISQAPLDFFRSLEPPCPEICGDCNNVYFCYGCIARPILAWERAKKSNKQLKCYWNEKTGFGDKIGIKP